MVSHIASGMVTSFLMLQNSQDSIKIDDFDSEDDLSESKIMHDVSILNHDTNSNDAMI